MTFQALNKIQLNTALGVCLMFSAISCGNPIVVERSEKIGKSDSNPQGTIREIRSKDDVLNWHHLDLEHDHIFGISLEKTYQNFKLSQEREIVVAVIDSGVDIDHADLQGKIWINKFEIPGNGIDDDQNGYIDDIHGWNFLGNKEGENLKDETFEVTRIYKKLKLKEEGHELSLTEQELFEESQREVKSQLAKYQGRFQSIQGDLALLHQQFQVLEKYNALKPFASRDEIEAIADSPEELNQTKILVLKIWDKYWRGFPGMLEAFDRARFNAEVGYNIDYDKRAELIGDDPTDFNQKGYGNPDVKGEFYEHGTHVAGIIAANRTNNQGASGIAGNVKIMALRAVPNGAERDKDIALAVRYAVDNGAKIINMSFAKSYSPFKEEVDKALIYAAERGVLLVHSAGNESRNTDFGNKSYPNHYMPGENGVLKRNAIPAWIEVGATGQNSGLNLIAPFSNFGKDSVTLFAPGERIYSTTPNDTYEIFSGTSMASPVVAGVAALLMSEFPTMNAVEVRNILLETAIKPKIKVRKPGQFVRSPDFRIPVPFMDLSQVGGIVNAFTAMKLAKDLANN